MDNNEILLKTLEKENKLIIQKYAKLEEECNNFEEKYNQLEERYNTEKQQKEEIIKERDAIQEQLDSILYSRSYKAIKKIKKILGR